MNHPSPLLGLAIGDALGMPFETRSPEDPFLKSWDGVTYLPSEYHKLQPGQWTDDTLMSTLLAESLLECDGYSPEDAAIRYCKWYVEGPHRGMGKTTKLALQALQAGVTWADSGLRDAEGNGTAMRAAPFGLFFRDDVWKILDGTAMDAGITHKSREAEEGSSAVALGVGMISCGITKLGLLDNVLTFLRPSKIRDKLLALEAMIGVSTAEEALKYFGTKAHVVHTVPSAFAAFLLTDSYLEAIQVAIRAGGDTDTTAAVAGALAGAYYGREGIPAHLFNGLERAGYIEDLDIEIWGRFK